METALKTIWPFYGALVLALGEVDDIRWLGPFAAWWALVIDRPTMLLSIATALPMIADGALGG